MLGLILERKHVFGVDYGWRGFFVALFFMGMEKRSIFLITVIANRQIQLVKFARLRQRCTQTRRAQQYMKASLAVTFITACFRSLRCFAFWQVLLPYSSRAALAFWGKKSYLLPNIDSFNITKMMVIMV